MFVEKTDFDATVHTEVLNNLTLGDDSILPIVVQRAIGEMEGYLSARYDTTAIFAATGNDRNQLVLMFCLDIAVYHVYGIGNPAKLSPSRTARYERAVEWLKAVQKGTVTISDAPRLPEPARGFFYLHSRPKRCNHF
jgi:phage gp36-like protein